MSVDQDLTVKVQPVKLARSIGDEAVIASGLQVGQRVVIDGQFAGDSRRLKSASRIPRKRPA